MKKKVIGAAGLAAAALVGGTFAYFSQSTTIDNPFDTAKYGTIVTEDFNPEDGEDWQPGAEVNKDLYVDNTGDRDVVVRVKFEDIWSRDGEAEPFKIVEGKDVWDVDPEDKPGESDRQPGDKLAEGKLVSNGLTSNGLTGDDKRNDKTVVDKKLEGLGDNWIFGEDGYFYYTKKVAPGASTGKFLDSVTLNKYTDMGQFETTYFFTIGKTEKGKPSFGAENGEEGADETNGEEGADEIKWISVTLPEGSAPDTWTARDVQELANLGGEASDYIKDLVGTAVSVVKEDEKDIYKLNSDYTIYTAILTEPAKDKLGYSDANYILRITVETVQATDEAVKNVFGEGVPTDVASGWQLDPESPSTEGTEPESSSEEGTTPEESV